MILLLDNGMQERDFTAQNNCLLYKFPLAIKQEKEEKPLLELRCIKMRKDYLLLSSKEDQYRDLFSYGCKFKISEANRALFHHRSRRGTIKILSVTSGTMIRHFRIKKYKTEDSKDITDIRVKMRRQNGLHPISMISLDDKTTFDDLE